MTAEAIERPAKLAYRLAVAGDLSFFLKSMLNSYYYTGVGVGPITKRVFYSGHTKRVEACLARSGTKLVVACLEDDPVTLLGFLLAEGHCVHYAYVKLSMRRHGLCRGMMQALGMTMKSYSHLTQHVVSALEGRDAVYDPYAF